MLANPQSLDQMVSVLIFYLCIFIGCHFSLHSPALGKSLNADEAPALGASYEAAVRSKGFRVKTFHVKAGATYPIEVSNVLI